MQNTEEPSFIALRFPYILVLCLLQSGIILRGTTTMTNVNSQLAAVQHVCFVDVSTSENFPY